jgi:glycosyltransferase involved in cell wall biosynthesis
MDCFYLFDATADCSYDIKNYTKLTATQQPKRRSKAKSRKPTKAGIAWGEEILTALQSKKPLSPSLLKGLVASPGPSSSSIYPTDLGNLIFTQQHFLNSEAGWHKIHKDYKRLCPESPFNHFFWHYQGLYRQVFRIAEIAQAVQPACCYHSISTGYAGFLGAALSAASGMPLIITEHGIYTRERRIDLNEADWLTAQMEQHSVFDLPTDLLVRKLWIRFFEQISLTTYAQASKITTLYESNRQFQIKEGAQETKTAVIRNGIDLTQFRRISKPKAPAEQAQRIALIGRVVSIKDVTTFIKSIAILATTHPNIEVLIVGPCDEQPEYVKQCCVLIDLLNLSNTVKLTGSQDISALLPSLDVVVLTSISEAQPLVLLEAMAAEVPVVATAVGACREIIEGFDPNKPNPCGIIVPVVAPEATATAISRLLSSGHLRHKLGATGRKRVEQFYDEKHMLTAYANTYQAALQGDLSEQRVMILEAGRASTLEARPAATIPGTALPGVTAHEVTSPGVTSEADTLTHDTSKMTTADSNR